MIVSAKQLPELKKTLVSHDQDQPTNFRQSLGKQGELQAETFLLQHAFSILDRNYRHGHGEIDLVAFDPATQEIVFVEVKTRSSLEYGDPSLAVAYKKRQTLYKTALDWIQTHHRPEDFRFDVIAITPQTVDYYPNISW